MKRIALLHTSLDVRGGAEKQVLNLARELKLLGHEVTLYVSRVDKDKCYSELMKGIDIVECGGYGYNNKKKETLYSFYYMKKMADKIQPCDIINCHNFPTTYAGVLAKKRLKVPLIWTCNEPPFPPLYQGSKVNHSLKSYIYRIIVSPFLIKNKLILKSIDKILVLDEMNKTRIKKTYNLDAEILWTGLDQPKIPKIKLKDTEEINLFTVSRLDKQRRIHDLIHLAFMLKGNNIPFKLVIAGGGPLEDELKKLAKGVSKYVKFLGRITDEELTKEYIKSDIVIFTPENQSWGLVPLEAGYFGKPSIISDGTGIADVFKDNALIYKVGNIQDLFNKLYYLLEDRKRISKMGASAREFVLKNFSWKKYAIKMSKILEEIK